jgi:hypothetical protein
MSSNSARNRKIAERILKRKLSKTTVVHHIDGDDDNNKPSNIVICEDQAYHLLLHKRERALKACGHADWIRCHTCKRYSPPEEMHNRGNHYWHAHH